MTAFLPSCKLQTGVLRRYSRFTAIDMADRKLRASQWHPDLQNHLEIKWVDNGAGRPKGVDAREQTIDSGWGRYESTFLERFVER